MLKFVTVWHTLCHMILCTCQCEAQPPRHRELGVNMHVYLGDLDKFLRNTDVL